MSASRSSVLERIDQLCGRYEDARLAGQRPHIDDYLRQVPEVERSEVLRELLRLERDYLQGDQRRRWQQGDRVLMQAYLEEAPSLRDYPELVFELVCGEVLLRAEMREKPQPADYLALVPTHQTQLHRFLVAWHLLPPETLQEPHKFIQPSIMDTTTSNSESDRWENMNLAVQATLSTRYELLGEVVRGGMGIVYRARHRSLDRYVAIKVMKPGASTKRFLREARLLAKINSPHVVTVHDFEVLSDNYPVIIMEWIEGTNLSDLIALQGGALSEEKVVAWMRHTCEGMLAAAKHGIIHRDLKPSNLLIDVHSSLKVADFGLARGLATPDELSQSGGVLGTPYYMAPEQADDPCSVDTRADIYSFGATFYHALTGKVPFAGATMFSILYKHKTEPLIPPQIHNPKLSENINKLLKRCLAKIPDDRFSSFSVVLDQLPPSSASSSQLTAPRLEVSVSPAECLAQSHLLQPYHNDNRVEVSNIVPSIIDLIPASHVDARHFFDAVLGMTDKADKNKQLRHFIQRCICALANLEIRDYEERKALHLDIAGAYAAVGDVILRDRHLNWACDNTIRQIITTSDSSRRAEYERQRDKLYEIIVRREAFQGCYVDREEQP
jgi:serine/threonine protein kinase